MDLNTLYYGDCLEWMRKWNDGSVDLIYLDPPFNSNECVGVHGSRFKQLFGKVRLSHIQLGRVGHVRSQCSM